MLIHQMVRKPLVQGDIGVEIEVEGKNLPHNAVGVWKYVEDGSLRGESAEYVLNRPIDIDAFPKALKKLNDEFINYESVLDFSFRTSVHVHVNVGGLELDELLAYMYSYLLLEKVLMRYCGDERQGNRFCLRFEDAEGQEQAFRVIMANKTFAVIAQDQYRYASMNIDAITKFGSLEFRGMRGTNDADVLSNWTKALVNLRNFSQGRANPKVVYDHFCHLGPVEFMQRALGDVADAFVYDGVANDMAASFSLTLDFPFYWEECNSPEPIFEEEDYEPAFDFDGDEE